MTYDNPGDYLDSEQEKDKKQKKWSIKKALKLAAERKTKEEKTDMDSDDIVKAAEKFNEFINDDED